ncbi:Regulator of sigma D [Klebsiella pneumoniae subsp. pneumoniae]|uniref:Regulator of sigma D n=1 Tax=Klebsiella pneumoniae subsp. pneumoniae TaxID=72407 RepID=A0A378AQA1_KLEPN|nr:Regulator of sigma D [Klebsiella pneumoniae subsp. pneumoniae]
MEGDTPLLAATRLYPQLEANTQQMMDYYDTCLENAIDHDNYLEFSRRCRISASRWRRVSRWKIN